MSHEVLMEYLMVLSTTLGDMRLSVKHDPQKSHGI